MGSGVEGANVGLNNGLLTARRWGGGGPLPGSEGERCRPMESRRVVSNDLRVEPAVEGGTALRVLESRVEDAGDEAALPELNGKVGEVGDVETTRSMGGSNCVTEATGETGLSARTAALTAWSQACICAASRIWIVHHSGSLPSFMTLRRPPMPGSSSATYATVSRDSGRRSTSSWPTTA